VRKSFLVAGVSFILASCSSSAPVYMDPEIIHKKDLTFCVEDIGCFDGAGVVPRRSSYNMELAPREEDSIDRVVFATCHQTKPYLMADLPKVDLPVFGKWFGSKKKGIKWGYLPDAVLEDTGDCDLYVYALDFESEDHAWAVMRTENPKYKLHGRVYCDGDGGRDYSGVSVCDGKAGTYQRIEFREAVQVHTTSKCSEPVRIDAGSYKIKVGKGKCPYLFKSQSGEAHSLVLYGWEGFNFKKR